MAGFTGGTTGDEIVRTYAGQAAGKTFLITGPSESGVGAQTAIFLAAAKPALIILAGRSQSKVQPVIDQIFKENPDVAVSFVALDLADNSSVRKAAETVKGLTKKVDVLINNAGVMAIEKYTTSKDGIEMQFAANHIGHFLLTSLLQNEIIAAAPGSRIVNVSSFGYMSGGVRYDDHNFHNGTEYNPWVAYAQSKTANILFADGLAKHLGNKGVLSFSLHPGLIFDSKLMGNVNEEMFADGSRIATEALQGDAMPAAATAPRSLAAGTSTSLYAALAPELESHNGKFLVDAAVWTEKLRPHAVGDENSKKLWELSEKLIGHSF